MKIRNRKSRNNENYAKIRTTSMLVIVDKTLSPYQGRMRLKQHNTSKLAKYYILNLSYWDLKVAYISHYCITEIHKISMLGTKQQAPFDHFFPVG